MHSCPKGLILPKVNDTYVAGDVRATENPGLSSLHTVFVREHNRIAAALHALDATLSDEELYQRTRRCRGIGATCTRSEKLMRILLSWVAGLLEQRCRT